MDNIPYLVKHDNEAHAVGGALVAAAAHASLPEEWPAWAKAPLAIGAAWAVGWAKEKLRDTNADSRDANMWAVGGGGYVLTITVLKLEW